MENYPLQGLLHISGKESNARKANYVVTNNKMMKAVESQQKGPEDECLILSKESWAKGIWKVFSMEVTLSMNINKHIQEYEGFSKCIFKIYFHISDKLADFIQPPIPV